MSLLTQAYNDPSPGTGPSVGPRLGFAGAFELAYDAQVRGWAQFGLERAFGEADAEQRRLIRERLGREPEGLSSGLRNWPAYIGMARFFENGGTPETADQVARWDAEIEKLRGQIPELRTYRELWEQVRDRAFTAEDRWERSATTASGMVGGILGEALASIDPRSDPLNTLSLGFGGAGRMVATRIASVAGGNAAVEAVNQFTGVQENRQLLRLHHSTGQAVSHILMAGAVGAGFQGGGELIAAGVRRMRGMPEIPQPPPTDTRIPENITSLQPNVAARVPAWTPTRSEPEPAVIGLRPSDLFGDADTFIREVRAPWATSRIGQRRMAQELQQTIAHMERWDGEGLPDITPRTSSTLHQPVTRAQVDAPWWIRDQGQVADELARHYDPDLYRQLDKIEGDRTRLSGRADELRAIQSTERAKHVDAELDRVAALEKEIETLRRNAGSKRYKQRAAQFKIDVITSQQRRILDAIKDDAQKLSDAQLEAVDVATRLNDLSHMRNELIPLRKHAEDVARGEMALHMPVTEALIMFDRMVAYGIDISPRLGRRASDVEQTRAVRDFAQPGETPAQTVIRATREASKEADDGEALTQRIQRALADQTPEASVDLGSGPMRLDHRIIVGATKDTDGRLVPETQTLREVLREISDNEAMIRAMTTCAKH